MVAYAVHGFCGHCYTVFKAMGCYYHYCPFQEARPCLTEVEFQRSTKKRELDELRKQYLQENGYSVIEMYECDWWKMCETDYIVKHHLRESFPSKMALREEKLLENIKSGTLFRYVQCDIGVPENFRETFTNFPPIFKNIIVGRDDIGPFMKE